MTTVIKGDSNINLDFSTGGRITGDFSNATIANRAAFQTSTANGNTIVSAISNGTGAASALILNSSSDPANSSTLICRAGSDLSAVSLYSAQTGTGSYLPMTFFTGGSERMRLDTSGNVGIGTSSPGYKLSITTSTGGGMNMSNGVDSTLRVLLPTTGITYDNVNYGYHAWLVGGSEKIRLDNNGNVGIGTSSPNKSSSSTALTVNTGTAANYSAVEWSSGNTLNYHINANDSAIYHVAAGTRPWIVYTNGSERMRIDSSGNVGVGTADMYGRINAQRSTGSEFSTISLGDFATASNSVGIYGRVTSAGIFGISTAGAPIAFYRGSPGTTESMRIDSSGNLLVGTTSFVGAGGMTFAPSAASPRSHYAGSATANSSTTLEVYSTGASAYRFYVGYGGTVYATSTSISAISDSTLKENVRDLETGLSEVMALKPRRFDWKNGDAQNVAGFVAQEVEQVLPELVQDYVYRKDEENGDIIKKSLKMGDILPTMVKAIQEQQAMIEQLKADVAALKGTQP